MKHIFALSLFLFTVYQLNAQDSLYAREIVRTLSSPEFKGRGYVEKGNEIAAAYIGEQFRTLGLKAFKKVYEQKFSIKVNTFPSAMILEIDGERLVPGKDYLIDPLSGPVRGSYSVSVIRKEDLQDIELLTSSLRAARGNVLLIDETGFKSDDKELVKELDQLVSYIKYSPDISLSAVIILTDQKLSWSPSAQQATKASFTVNRKLDLKNISKVKMDVDATLSTYQTQNLTAYIPGSQEPDSFLVVLAHYDHLGMMGKETYFPGANDNASGIAMLLNLARYYKDHPNKYTMVFIALGAEETGLEGAGYFVNHPLFDLNKILFLVNFDLAGTGDEGIKVVNGSVYRDEFNRLKALNEAKAYLPAVQIRGAACNSDHCLFYQKGVPSFYIYTLGGIQAYHDIYDRCETLPLTEFYDYCQLMIDFFNGF